MKVIKIVMIKSGVTPTANRKEEWEVELIDQTSAHPVNRSDQATLLDFEMMLNRITTARFHLTVEDK
jgi:hypothetical protein